jgi:hypothetical protein
VSKGLLSRYRLADHKSGTVILAPALALAPEAARRCATRVALVIGFETLDRTRLARYRAARGADSILPPPDQTAVVTLAARASLFAPIAEMHNLARRVIARPRRTARLVTADENCSHGHAPTRRRSSARNIAT